MVKHKFGADIYYKGDYLGTNFHEIEIDDDDEQAIIETMKKGEHLAMDSVLSDLYYTVKARVYDIEQDYCIDNEFPYEKGIEFQYCTFQIIV